MKTWELVEFFVSNKSFSNSQPRVNGKESDSKRPKQSQDDEDNVTTLVCVKRLNNEHLIDINWLDESELIAVGVNPVTMIAQLPASIKEKRFGVS